MIYQALFFVLVSSLSRQLQAQTVPVSCIPNPCGPNNICSITSNSTIACACNNLNVVGSRCQLTNPCNTRPCGVNGACFPLIQSVNGVEFAAYYCQCYSGFSGTNCQNVNPKPCVSSPCLNGGFCNTDQNTWDYYCTCVGPYTGKNCGSYIDYCSVNRCQNNAVCIPDTFNGNYSCSCQNGFYGAFCELEINECNVTLGNGIFGSPCQNNATCFDLVDNYFCQCNGPYAGPNCETFVNPCIPNPCGAGATCSISNTAPGGYTCACTAGFFGNPCIPNPCLSNPCFIPTSQCVPIEPGTLTIVAGCTCPSSNAAYVCVCAASNPPFASASC